MALSALTFATGSSRCVRVRSDAPHPMAARVAAADCALLLTGATGTGKGYVAQWIHDHSPRAKRPLVPVNCGAIPESLIDSHLFGHAKGAFSGAGSDHLGLIRAASGGTVLFDEISELPAGAQRRLLRLLEEREVQPVGYSKPVVVDVRVIAATNANLGEAVCRGTFRQDLFYRLDIVRLHLDPLRERASEVPSLLAQFNSEFAAMYRQPELTFEEETLAFLEQYRWPGNIRELRTVLERLHVLCGSTPEPISIDDLQRFGQLRTESPAGLTFGSGADRLAELKLDAVNQILSQCRGNISRAANTLGVHRSTLYRWLASA